MSVLETLLAMMILGIAALGMSTGVMFANVQFTRSMLRSQSKVLYSTLQNIIQVELAYTGDRGESSRIEVSPIDGASGRYKLEAFRSTFFAPDESEDQLSSFVVTTESGRPQISPADGRAYGNLALQAEGDDALPLVSIKTVYTEGMGASVQITYAEKRDAPYVPAHFTADLRIYDKRGDILQQGTFDVIPLREPVVDKQL